MLKYFESSKFWHKKCLWLNSVHHQHTFYIRLIVLKILQMNVHLHSIFRIYSNTSMQVWNAEQLIFIFWIQIIACIPAPRARWSETPRNWYVVQIICSRWKKWYFMVNSCVKSIKRLMFDILFAGFPLNKTKSQILKHLSNLVWQQAWAPACSMPRPRSIVAHRKKSWTQRPDN